MQKPRIQNLLMNLARAGKFYLAEYDHQGFLSAGEAVSPKSVSVNEVSSEFDDPVQFRRFACRERSSWTWSMLLAFDKEVIVEEFEEALTEKAIILPSEPSKKLLQVTIKLLSCEYIHPVRMEAAAGSKVSLTFQVQVGPK